MKIEYNGDNPQFLGVLNGKPCVISSEKSLDVSGKNLSILKERKWFNHLVNKGLIKIDGKTEEVEIKQDEKPKKKKKKEKVIQVDVD